MFFFFILNSDSPNQYQFGYQDPATYLSEVIINLHYHIMYILVFIVFFVSYFLLKILISIYKGSSKENNIKHNVTLEILWTIFPILIITIILVPSFNLLIKLYDIIDPTLTLKIIGHQWYWSYEYSDYDNPIIFDSIMVPTEDLNIGDLRLLEVDNKVVLPINTNIRLLITSADVLHSWSVPSFGVKMDAVPGRLNEVNINILREGIFYGQCSEICGVNHGFMPIVVEAVSIDKYIDWLIKNLN